MNQSQQLCGLKCPLALRLQSRTRTFNKRNRETLHRHKCSSAAALDDVPGKQSRQCNYRATISYDGTNYKGFQLQPGAPTIQGQLELCLGKILQTNREELGLIGSGRTDAGVHAKGQVINFFCNRTCCKDELLQAMNRLLPADIRALSIDSVPLNFSARYSAVGKEYRFQICNGRIQDPFLRSYSQHVYLPLDIESMRQAAQLFLGRHDFTQFANQYQKGVHPEKVLTRFDIIEKSGDRLQIEVEGNGFLYRMVRHMVGALIEIGKGTLEASQIRQLLAMGSSEPPGRRHRPWAAAEAKGLYLHAVFY